MIEVLTKNFGFETTDDDDYGLAVKMSARDAFRYSLIEGSPYLFDEYGFTCKEQLKVFYHRSSLNLGYYMYCPGLFGVKRTGNELLLEQGNAPFYLNKEFPKLFSGEKTIIFSEYDTSNTTSRAEFERTIHKQISDRSDDPSDYLLTLVTNTSALKESFLEYVACEYFNRRNYLTENQVPFENNEGIPDFAAYSFPEIELLVKNKFIEGGCCIPEIATACVFDNSTDNLSEIPSQYDVLLGEAKASQSPKKQLDKHQKLELASYLFGIKPFNSTNKTEYGLLHYDNDCEITFNRGTKQSQKTKLLKTDAEFLKNYIKFYLIANLSIEKIKSNFTDSKSSIPESEQLITNVIDIDFVDLIKWVKKEMNK